MRLLLIFCLLPFSLPASEPMVTGGAQTVFAWAQDRCATWDIPDAPARAWRDLSWVHLVAASETTRESRGPTLDRLTRDCAVIHTGQKTDDPAAFDDRSWLASPYLEPSGRLMALVHVEFHGHERPEICNAGHYAACWWNSIVETRATGRDFGPGQALVAALPLPYRPNQSRRQGYFNPSNIIERDGFLHAFVFAEAGGAQRRGACLIRRPVGGSMTDWRAWDGHDFTVRFANPYQEAIVDPAAHVCAPIAGVKSTISSVVRSGSIGLYLAVTPTTGPDGVTGIWWMTSPDLIRWSVPRLLLSVPLLWARECGQDAAYAYPSLLDSRSDSTNFETVGDRFWLYLVRIRLDSACQTGPERDLVRIPVSWPAPGAE